MNVVLPESTKISKKTWIAYMLIIFICIISLIIAFYLQFYGRVDILGTKDMGTFGKKDDDELVKLEEGFTKIFTNQIINEESEYNNKKENADRALVYTKYHEQKSEGANYNIDVTVPYINVKSDTVASYNKQIETTLTEKSKSILSSTSKNTIYQISYAATVEEGILSLVIQTTLKENTNAQRLMIKTYNYDLRNNKEISLAEVLRIKNLKESDVQTKINKKIESEHKKSQDLLSLGFNVFDRNIDDDIYKIENTTEFYLSNEALYIIYPYGNKQTTNEMDIIIF